MKDYSHLNKQCIGFNVSKLQRAVVSLFNYELIRKHELKITIGHFTVLAYLTNMKKKTITEMSEELGMDRTTLIRNAQVLLKYGYIASTRGMRGDNLDKRSHCLSITDKGIDALEAALPVWEDMNRRLLEESKRIMGYQYRDDATFVSQMIDDLNGIYQIATDLKGRIRVIKPRDRKYQLASLV